MSTRDPNWRPGTTPPEREPLPNPRHGQRPTEQETSFQEGLQAGGTVYGAGRTPLKRSAAPRGRDRLLFGAALAGAAGVVAGLLFATGLTPFGPPERDVATDSGSPSWNGGPQTPSAAQASTPAPSPSASPSASPSPSATAAAGQIGTLRSVESSLCLDVAGQPVDGGVVTQVPCTGAPTQVWRMDRAGDVLVIVNTATGACLDVAGGSRDNFVAVQQWTCADVPQQRWRAGPAGNAFSLISLASDKCLDVPGASHDQGVRIHQYDCNGTGAQQWAFGQ